MRKKRAMFVGDWLGRRANLSPDKVALIEAGAVTIACDAMKSEEQ
jgi:hypothetical protein